jgi:hypothetical protein
MKKNKKPGKMKNKENRASLVAPHNPYAVSAALVLTANWYEERRKANPLRRGRIGH